MEENDKKAKSTDFLKFFFSYSESQDYMERSFSLLNSLKVAI